MGEHPRFGRAVGEHAGRFGAGGWLWYIGGILVAAAALNAGQGVLALVGGPSDDVLTKLATAAIAGAIGAVVLAVAAMRWRQTVTVYERGLVHTKLLGTTELAFADVRGVELVRTHSRSGTTEELHVALRDGSEITIGHVTSIEQLAGMIGNARVAA